MTAAWPYVTHPAAIDHADTLALLSGGLDSAVLLARLRAEGYRHLKALHFQFNSPSRELRAARRIARRLDVPLQVIDLRSFMRACETRSEPHHLVFSSVVLFSMAITFANEHGIGTVAAGVNQVDVEREPALHPEIFAWLEDGARRLDVRTVLHLPFHSWTKAQIVQEGARLCAPMDLSWSCVMLGAELHDGGCHACRERQAAFRLAGVPDPTQYSINPSAPGTVVDVATQGSRPALSGQDVRR